AALSTEPCRHRVDQLADAMHDEGDLRAVPAAPHRPGDGQGDDRVLLLEPGPAAGRRRLEEPRRPPPPEHRPGKADRPLGAAPAGERALTPSVGDRPLAPKSVIRFLQ